MVRLARQIGDPQRGRSSDNGPTKFLWSISSEKTARHVGLQQAASEARTL
jgi:hypothetical protein